MTAFGLPRLDHPNLAAVIADCERRAAEKEVEVLRLAEQTREAQADVQQIHVLLAYLRKRITAS